MADQFSYRSGYSLTRPSEEILLAFRPKGDYAGLAALRIYYICTQPSSGPPANVLVPSFYMIPTGKICQEEEA